MITKKSLKTYNGAYYTHILAGVLSPRFPDQSDLTQRNMCKGPYFISVLTLSLALTSKSLPRGPTSVLYTPVSWYFQPWAFEFLASVSTAS